MFKLMTHENQHGYGVSLVKYENDELINGFVLNTMDTLEERETYVKALSEMTGFEIEAM